MFFRRARLLFPVFAFYLVAPGVWAHAIEIPSQVVSATVFSDRAMVTREARPHVPAGAHTVVIADMSAGLDETSVRVQGKAAAAVKIGTVEVKTIYLTELASAAEREKAAALEAKTDQKAMLEGEIHALETRESFIDRIVDEGADKHEPNAPAKLDFAPEKWAQAWGLLQNGMAETQKNLAAKHIEMRKLDAEIAKLQAELNQVRSTQARQRRDIHVNVEAAQDTDLQLSITYQTAGVSWRPVYDARLDTGSGALALEQYGLVTQQTGEEWKDIALTFSTAQPAQGSEMPGLYPWWVALLQPIQAFTGAAGGAVLDAMQREIGEKGDRLDADLKKSLGTPKSALIENKPATPVQAVAQTSEYAAEFHVPGHVDLKSANDPTKLFIGAVNMKAGLSAQVTPRLAAQAFLFAKVTNGESYPLIPGEVAKYRDGAFIGNAALKLLRPNETASLSFGVDDRIKVLYQRSHDEVSNPALIVVGDITVERQYLTKIENLHKDPVPVTVFEQYPVSASPDVKSELTESVTTAGYAKDPENRQGVIVWTGALNPKEEKAFTIGFRVKYPKDRQITGL